MAGCLMSYIFKWCDVDISDPELSDKEQMMLSRSMEKLSQYIRQGRLQDAHGAAAVILIAYHCLKGIDPFDFDDIPSAQVPL